MEMYYQCLLLRKHEGLVASTYQLGTDRWEDVSGGWWCGNGKKMSKYI